VVAADDFGEPSHLERFAAHEKEKRVLGMKSLLLIAFAAAQVFAASPELRVSDTDARKAAIEKRLPAYPAAAKQLRISGKVELEAIIGTDGHVEEVKFLAGNPLLTKAGVDALKAWKFNPFTLRAAAILSFDFRQ
jgi:TonB family protein